MYNNFEEFDKMGFVERNGYNLFVLISKIKNSIFLRKSNCYKKYNCRFNKFNETNCD